MISFADVHCHLEMCEDISGIISRARESNVKAIVTNGVNPKSNRAALEFSKKYKEVKAALGIYPIDALSLNDSEIDKEIKFIMTERKSILAIGEVGLDFKEDRNSETKQKYVFRKMIELASEIDKPLIIHSRKAEKECVEILESAGAKKVIMHCFSGKRKLVERIYLNGWFLSIPTSIVYNKHFMEIAKEIPLQNLLCETDSPFLHPSKEKNNEPSLVTEGYRMIAQIKGLDLEDVSRIIALNYEKIFGEKLAV